MEITPQNIIFHELIGLPVEVVKHKDPTLIGLKGKIVYETKNMFHIEDTQTKKIKKVPKKFGVYHVHLPHGYVVEIEGKVIAYRPEDRLKLKIRRKW